MTAREARTGNAQAARRKTRAIRHALGADLRALRVDAGVSQRAVARAAGLDSGYLSRIEAGTAEPSLTVLGVIAEALGADLSVRLRPGADVPIRDLTQARMIEALLGSLHPRWARFVEVPVLAPTRGRVDLVLGDRAAGLLVAVEAQSELRRLEQQIGWAAEKAAALARTDLAALARSGPDQPVAISRLLLLRSTARTRELARTFERTLAAAYPARTRDVLASLTTTEAAWPGAGIVWVRVEGRRVSLLLGPPRGVMLGR